MLKKFTSFAALIALVSMFVLPGSTQAYFWRTDEDSGPYTSPGDPETFGYGYGYGSAGYGYGYGYGYSYYVSDKDGTGYPIEVGDAAYDNPTTATAATLVSSYSLINGAGTEVTITEEIMLPASPGSSLQATFPSGTIVTEASGGTLVRGDWLPTTGSAPVADVTSAVTSLAGSMDFGETGKKLLFSKPVQLIIPVSGVSNGDTIIIRAKHYGDTDWNGYSSLSTSSSATCSAAGVISAPSSHTSTVSSGTITIYTCAASQFAAYAIPAPPGNTPAGTGGGGGGGGGGDRCKERSTGRWLYGTPEKDSNYCKKSTTVVAATTTGEYTIGEVAAAFTDTARHWAKDYIETLRLAGIVHGKSVGMFAPNDSLTRAELTKIALGAFGVPTGTVSANPFSDVAKDIWYAPYITKAKELGIVSGYADGKFRPNQSINRAEALKILVKASGLAVTDASEMMSKGWTYAHFKDVPVSAWYANYVDFAKTNSIVSGYANGDFGPGNPVLRGEMAKIAVNTMNLAK